MDDARTPVGAMALGAEGLPRVEDALRDRFNRLTGTEKIVEYFYDSNTGLPNERGFEALHGAARADNPLVAHFSVEGTKFVNEFGHDQGQLLYRMAARALHEADPDIAKVRGDFASRLRSSDDAQRLADRANALLPDEFKGFTITVATGRSLDEAGKAHAAWKQDREESGDRAKRGSRPHGISPGWNPGTTPFPTQAVEQAPHVPLVKAYWKLDRETALEAYRDPMTGLLGPTGMGAVARGGDKVLSIDIDGLKATDAYDSSLADEVIRKAGAFMRVLGGEELQAAHPHGDEFAAAHPDATVLQTYAKHLERFLKIATVSYTNVDLAETFVQHGIGLSYGIGDTYEEAERNLERHKQQRALAGDRDRKGEFAIAQGRLERRPADSDDLRRAGARELGSDEHHRGRARDLEPGHEQGGERSPHRSGGSGVPGRDEAARGEGSLGRRGVPPDSRGARSPRDPRAEAVANAPDAHRVGEPAQEPPRALLAVGIRPETLTAEPFVGRFRQDDQGRVVFPHEGWKRDARGGKRRIETGTEIIGADAGRGGEGDRCGIWESAGRGRPEIRRIVVTEQAIDAMSYHQMQPDPTTHYVSLGGRFTPEKQSELRDVIELQKRVGRDVTVVAAFGHSRDAAQFTADLESCVPKGVAFTRDAPVRGRGWNDIVQAKERDLIRSHGLRSPQRPQGEGLALRR